MQKDIKLQQTSDTPITFDVLYNGQYRGILFYSWETNIGNTRGWTLIINDDVLQFKHKEQVIRYLQNHLW